MEAAQFMVPSAVSAADRIRAQRQEAAGKFLSASHPGLYQIPTEELPTKAPSRHIDLD